MVRLSLFTTVSLIPSAFGLVGPVPRSGSGETAGNDLQARQGGYYFQNWSEGGSNIRCQNGAGGTFSANWNSKGGFVCGKGWSGGGAR